jgi:hypothetical protein
MLVKLLKYIVKRSKGVMSYFVSLLGSPDPLPLPLLVPLALNKNRVKQVNIGGNTKICWKNSNEQQS